MSDLWVRVSAAARGLRVFRIDRRRPMRFNRFMPTDAPNLLFIFTDEQRLDTLRCYGNAQLDMPNLNRFAETACVFVEPHCAAPVCTPSRGSLMTGVYPWAHGAMHNNIPLDAEARCLPELLPDADRDRYAIEYHGKWHLGDEIFAQHGFERFVSIEDEYIEHYGPERDRDVRSDYHHWLLDQGFSLGPHDKFSREFAARLPERFTKAAYLAQTAGEFIRAHRGEPWMLTVNMLEPHMPFFGPRDRQYPVDDVPLPANADHDPREDPTLPAYLRQNVQRFYDEGHHGFTLRTEDQWRWETARYWGLNSMVDAQVGHILRTLRESGQEANTLVVFTSDHGELMASHRLLGKGNPYKESLRVPLLVRLPGQTTGCRVTTPVSQIDLLPTLLELLGQAIPDHLHGRSLAGVLRDGAASGGSVSAADAKSPCISTWNVSDNRWRSITTDDGWVFTYSERGEHMLFNLREDPDERINLAADPDHLNRMRDLADRIAAWRETVDDPLVLQPVRTVTG